MTFNNIQTLLTTQTITVQHTKQSMKESYIHPSSKDIVEHRLHFLPNAKHSIVKLVQFAILTQVTA